MVKQMHVFGRIKRLFLSEKARRDYDAAEIFLQANDSPDTDDAFNEYFEFVDDEPENAASMQRLNEVWDGTEALVNPPYPTASELSGENRRLPSFLGAHAVVAAVGFSLIAVAASVVFLAVAPPQPNNSSIAFSTDRGERRSIVLEDGSTVTLGAASQIEVAIDDTSRLVALVAGDTYLDVAPDKSRAFVVQAGAVKARAVGTEFSVNRRHDTVSVAVSEGIVEVLRGDPEKVFARLTAGRQIQLKPTRDGDDVEAININNIAAWRRGVLILDDETLPYAIDTINRYYSGSVTIDSARLNNIRASGVVDMYNPGPWLESLQSVLPVQVQQTGENTYVLSHKSKP